MLDFLENLAYLQCKMKVANKTVKTMASTMHQS